jgi:alkylation response protein AidB-like acyl-CoA dehydrogenase
MDFTEPEHITMLRDSVRRFLDQEARPEHIDAWEKADHVPLSVHRKLGELGLCAVTVAEEYGGAGRDIIATVAIIEELARRYLTLSGVYIATAGYGGLNLSASGSEAQKRALLPRIAKGEIMFAYGLSEPDVGADLASVKTRCERRGDTLIINGAKRWCSGADTAEYIIMLVKSDSAAPRYKNLSFVLVPPRLPGITITKNETMGARGISTCDVSLDDVQVPAENILGGEAGWNTAWALLAGPALEAEKLVVPAQALGVAEAALAEAWQYSQERVQFGEKICAFQSIRHTLADAKTKLQACRLMLYWAASLADRELPCSAETSMAKLYVCDTARDVVLACQQILGAYGYAKGFAMERYVRDILATPIYGGSSAIQKNNIANRLGLPRR